MSSRHFCLKWNNFQTNILNAFESLQNTEDLTDVTLTCESGYSIKAHKFILSACSPYFRAVFKGNPCSHPIVILKDVAHADLIAITNFMYHGEVLVAEEQLPSFLHTAKLLQVSGLNEPQSGEQQLVAKSPKKARPQRTVEVLSSSDCPSVKKLKVFNKQTAGGSKVLSSSDNSDNLVGQLVASALNVDDETNNKIKIENDDDNLIDNSETIPEKSDKQPSSILEAALDPKPSSILERSLTTVFQSSSCGKSLLPTDVAINSQQTTFSMSIPRKPPEFPLKSSSDSSSGSSPQLPQLLFDRHPHPTDILQQSIKIEGEDDTPCDQNDCDLVLPPGNDDHIDDNIDDNGRKEGGGGCAMMMMGFQISPKSNSQEGRQQSSHHSSQCGNCPHCGKVYSNQSALKYHVRLVHSDLTNMYCCHLCPEAFDYREGYKIHMIEVHSIRN